MTVKLLHSSPLWLASHACRMSHDSHDKSDTVEHYDVVDGTYLGKTIGKKDKELIARVGNKFKHKSILEQLVYWFDIDGISRACLQELARHRHQSLTVKSTRYTLKELKDDDYIYDTDNFCTGVNYTKYCVPIDNFKEADIYTSQQLQRLAWQLRRGMSNDKAKYMLPENYKVRLQTQFNGRSLQNFLELRSNKDALWEIRQLAREIYTALPEEHKYLYEPYMKDN